MRALKTERSNLVFKAPPGSEGRIFDLDCEVLEIEGIQQVCSVWVPTPEERLRIANGENVKLWIQWNGAFPPVALSTTDETVLAENVI